MLAHMAVDVPKFAYTITSCTNELKDWQRPEGIWTIADRYRPST